MLGFFSLFNREPKPAVKDRFTTQAKVLKKYGVEKSLITDQVLGMCNPMSNEYALANIKGEDPTELLSDDLNFLNRSIALENIQGGLHKKGIGDTHHIAFTTAGLQHKETTFVPGHLAQQIEDSLWETDHMLMTFPENDKYLHQVYFGRDAKSPTNCRFFDANLPGGERKGTCPELVAKFAELLGSAYPKIKTSNIEVGMSMGAGMP